MIIEEITDIDQLKRINRALMARVESSMDQQGNAFSLFQTAINLEGQVKRRTDELRAALRGVEKMNAELENARLLSEKANLSKTKFLAAASHDILQPLNAALLSISVLADLQKTELGRDLACQIERSLDTMSDLLKTLLDISKLDAGIVEPRIESIPIAGFISGLLSEFMPVAEEKKLDLRIRSPEICILSDKTMLRRILQNLVSNGLRYTSKGGVLVGVRNKGSYALIEVTDTGSGIPAEHHEHIFEEFHRGQFPSGHQRDADSGLGLGLSIVQRMASTLNHSLELRSRENRGTRFRLTVPVAERAPCQQISEDAQVPDTDTTLKGTRILLIENDPAGIRAASSLFDSWQCETKVAGNVVETISSLGDTGWQPDIFVVDLHLDNGDLGTVAVQAARDYIGKFVPALIITADPTKSLEREINEMDMELMHKPLKPARLRAMLSHMVG